MKPKELDDAIQDLCKKGIIVKAYYGYTTTYLYNIPGLNPSVDSVYVFLMYITPDLFSRNEIFECNVYDWSKLTTDKDKQFLVGVDETRFLNVVNCDSKVEMTNKSVKEFKKFVINNHDLLIKAQNEFNLHILMQKIKNL